jgi:hypothetical protein
MLNELRLGNYIEYGEYNYVKVTFDIFSMIHDDMQDDAFQPIPLTEDWLLKFGFVHSKTDKSNVYKLGSIFRFVYCFEGKFKGKDMLMFGNIQLDKKNHLYVHQLQNLYFALTGEELELC